jgi:hypothetical protein
LPLSGSHTAEGGFFLAMQKLCNVMSIAAFAMSSAMVIGGVMLYTSIPSLTKRYLSEMKLELTETILNSMPVPEIPDIPGETGPAIRFP